MAADRSWRRIAWLILGIGGLIVAGGVALGYGSLRLALYGERTIGEVIEIVREGDMYSPVVLFRLPSGRLHEVRDLGVGAPDFALGDEVIVYYAPGNPDDFRLGTFERLWASAIIVTGFGGFWLLFGLVAWGLSSGGELFILGERAFGTIAAAAFVLGIWATWNAYTLYASGARGEGTVVDVRESTSRDEETITRPDGREYRRTVERKSYAPVVRFATATGREIEFFGRGGSGASYAIGARVPVLYDPAEPIRAYILSFVDLWLPSVAAWAVALIFGGAVWLSRRVRGA